MEQNIHLLNSKLNYITNIQESDKERFKSMIAWAGEMFDLTVKERLITDIFPKRAEVWTCNLGENVGCEVNKIRPVIVTSNDIGNANSPIITVIPISHREERQPTHVKLAKDDFKYMESYISGTTLAEQIKVVSKARLGRKIGEINDSAMKKVEQSILISLGILTAS